MSRASSILLIGATIAGFAGSALFHILVAAGTPAIGAVAAPAAEAQELRATRFVLVDAQNRTRAVIGSYEAVYASGDKNPPKDKQMMGLVVYDAEGKPGTQLGTGGGVSRLEMRGDMGWMTLGVHPDGSGVGIWVPESTLRFGFGMQQDGNGGFVVQDVSGHERFSGGMPPAGGVSMSLKEADGHKVWSAP